ncbi:hypothetical protein HII31_08090 [Pseudocercospora fuligena]|uniref:Uncharacterized protein n=1 Tax=Pseudocercospora fuligena TaxID=685502 RepID=A0A8H6RH17_9PEZI|nr:hypothetical protein HII31_08090 [Pseudocercospora fuligena]
MSLPANQIIQSFTEAFYQAQALFEQDKMAECEHAARVLLAEPALPRPHRIRTLLLLVNVVDDWNEAWCFHDQAKLQWYYIRRNHPQGQNSDVDKEMERLWDLLVEHQETLDEEKKYPDEEEEDEDMDSDEEAEDEDMDSDEEAEDEDMGTLMKRQKMGQMRSLRRQTHRHRRQKSEIRPRKKQML